MAKFTASSLQHVAEIGFIEFSEEENEKLLGGVFFPPGGGLLGASIGGELGLLSSVVGQEYENPYQVPQYNSGTALTATIGTLGGAVLGEGFHH